MKKSVIFRYAILLLIACILFYIVFFIKNKNKSSSYQSPAPAIEYAYPVIRDISQSIVLNGYIEARSMIPIVPLVSGIIIDYPIKAGDVVKTGDVIAKIDSEPFLQQMYQAKAAFLGYENTFNRVQQLYDSNSTTKQNYESVKAQRDAAKAQYELSELQLGYATVTSPIDGTVLAATSSRGNVGTSTQSLAIVADLNDLVVRLNVPEKYFNLFSRNKEELSSSVIKNEINSFSEKQECGATIDTVAPYIDSKSKTFTVVFSIEKNDFFKPGMYIQVKVNFLTKKNLFALPLNVLKVDNSCYIYDEATNKAQWVSFPIEVKDENWFMVNEQYTDKKFIVSGQNIVFDGQSIGNVTEVTFDVDCRKLVKK